jgi:hypothetical protein
MKTKIRSMVAGVMLLAMLNLTVTTSRAAQSPGSTLFPAKAAGAAPRIVANRAPLSVADLAKYQQKTLLSKQAANDRAAGASGNKTVWIVLGVAAAVGLVALAAGGGGGGGGGMGGGY